MTSTTKRFIRWAAGAALTMACLFAIDASACTSAIISGRLTKDGRPLMWKNRDTSNPYNCVVYQKGERYGYVAVVNSNTALHPRSVWMGVNEKGFAIMNTVSYNLMEDGDSLGGKANGAIMRRALEICATVEDFKTLLDTLKRPLYAATNYGVIDAAGGASYFETRQTGYKQYDVNDSATCPEGFIARSNYSMSGTALAGKGYPRWQQTEDCINGALHDGSDITPEWIVNQLSRSFANPVMGIDLTSGQFNKPYTNGWFYEQDFIARRKSTSAVVIQGVKKGEDASHTIMWTSIGYPPVTPIVPVWASVASDCLPNCVAYDSQLKDAPLCHYADAIRQKVYSYDRGDNRQEYFNWELLFNKDGNGYMQRTQTFESQLAETYEKSIATLRRQKKVDKRTVSQLYSDIDLRIADWMKANGRQEEEKDERQSVGMTYLDQNTPLFDSIQKAIHHYAELGYQEYKSSSLLQQTLRDNGFEVTEGIAGMPTAFVASYGSGQPTVALMAEYDALPGMSQDTVPYLHAKEGETNGHACGHNLLGTGSVAGAIAISKWLAQGHKGTIRLYGCPAEEGGGGKAYLVREHCFDGVDAVIDWHPSADNSVYVETGLANVHMMFRFHGKSAHASFAPEKGRSALDAAEAFDHMMNLMREHVPMTTRIHYIIKNGGQAANIVPDFAEVEYFIRSPKRDIVEDVKQRAIKAAEGAALGTGTTLDYETESGNYERLYNHIFSQMLQKHLEEVGGVIYDQRESDFARTMIKASGSEDFGVLTDVAKVKPLAPEKETLTGASSDVGNVSWVVPTASFGTATFVPCGGGHCWQQTAAGGMSIGTKGMMNTARVQYLSAIDLYKHPQLVKDIKSEFERRRGKDFHFVPLMGDRKPPLDYRKQK